MVDTDDKRPGDAASEVADAVLVPMDEQAGIYLVRGEVEGILEAFDGEMVPWLAGDLGRGLDDALALSTGVANTAIQAVHGINQATGLVRLAPQTLAAMRAGATPLVSGGQQLGTLAKGGKIVAQVRFLPVGAAGATAALAAIGPAIAIAAVQWQLSKISRAVQENIALTQMVLDDLREESWFELEGACDVMRDEASRAMRTGILTAHQWEYVQAQSSMALLRKHQSRRRRALLAALGRLRTDKPQDWLSKDFARAAEAARGLTLTARAALLHDTLRAAHVRASEPDHGAALAQDVLDQASGTYQRTVRELDTVLREIHARLSLVRQVDARTSFRLRQGSPDATVEVAIETVATLHDIIRRGPGRDLDQINVEPRSSAAHVLGFSPGSQTRMLERVRWIAPDEKIQLLATGIVEWDTRKLDLLLVTDRRAVLVDRQALDRGRVSTLELPNGVVATGHREGDFETVKLSGDDRVGSLRIRHGDGMRVRQTLTDQPRADVSGGHESRQLSGAEPATGR